MVRYAINDLRVMNMSNCIGCVLNRKKILKENLVEKAKTSNEMKFDSLIGRNDRKV